MKLRPKVIIMLTLPILALSGLLIRSSIGPLFASNAVGASASDDDTGRLRALETAMEKLRPLHKPLGKPKPGDWLAVQPETGQTFREYVASRPILPEGDRRTLYIQPLGDFTPPQRRIVDLTADFMGRYFGLPVKVREDLPPSLVPPRARRTHPSWGMPQILSTYVLDEVLRPRLPRDAAVYLALTASDLWPGEGWNFVFGQASLRERVGVWSLYRNGNPDAGPEAFRLCLLRTLKTATHEAAHMFSVPHCIYFECAMNGSNSQQEKDSRPIWLCPIDAAKLAYATDGDLVERYRSLKAFFEQHGFPTEAAFIQKSIEALK